MSSKDVPNFLRQILGKPDLGIVMGTFIFALILVSNPQLPLFNVFSDQDPPWLIKTGLWILDHQALPTLNPFSNQLPGLTDIPIVCYQWLFEILLGTAYRLDGLVGVNILVAALYGLFILGLYYWLCTKKIKPMPYILLPVVFGLVMLKSCAIARPILASCVLTPILLILLNPTKAGEEWTTSRRMGLWFLMALWANLHLGFVTGIVIAGVYLIGQALNTKSLKPILVWVGCIVATCLNPYQFHLYSYFLALANSPFMNTMIMELKPIPFHTAPNALLFFMVSIASACFVWRDSRLSRGDRLLWLLSFGAGLYSSKHAYLFAIFSLPVMGLGLEKSLGYLRQFKGFTQLSAIENSSFNAITNKPVAWVALWCIIAIACHGFIKPGFAGVSDIRGVMGYIRQHHMKERILCNEMWGSYLLFYTDSRCVLDTRMDMYGDPYVKRYLSLYFMQGDWQHSYREEMAKGLRYAIYPKSETAALVLQNVYHWKPVYQDKHVVLIEAPHP